MLDRQGIYQRYASCFPTAKPAQLAAMLNLRKQTVHDWMTGKRMVPRARLKELVDSEGLSWDWLLEGILPKHQKGEGKPFNRGEINKRFLDLFPGESQGSLGKLFNVNQPSVYKWHHNLLQVPWETLKYAVDNKNVTWEWLLEGR